MKGSAKKIAGAKIFLFFSNLASSC